MDKAMDKFREIMESGKGEERTRSDSEEYAQLMADEILNAKDLSEEEQTELVRQLELQTLQMMDEMYAGEESPSEEMRGETFEERLMSGAGEGVGATEEDIDTESRLYEYQRTIDRLKTVFKEKQALKKESQNKDVVMNPAEEEQKKPELKREDVEMTDEEEEDRKQIE